MNIQTTQQNDYCVCHKGVHCKSCEKKQKNNKKKFCIQCWEAAGRPKQIGEGLPTM